MAENQDQHAPVLSHSDQPQYAFKLFITGMSPRSLRAVSHIKRICQQHLSQRHELEIIDLYQHPAQAAANHVLASPTLLKTQPLPVVRLLGDLSNTQGVLASLGIAGSEPNSFD